MGSEFERRSRILRYGASRDGEISGHMLVRLRGPVSDWGQGSVHWGVRETALGPYSDNVFGGVLTSGWGVLKSDHIRCQARPRGPRSGIKNQTSSVVVDPRVYRRERVFWWTWFCNALGENPLNGLSGLGRHDGPFGDEAFRAPEACSPPATLRTVFSRFRCEVGGGLSAACALITHYLFHAASAALVVIIMALNCPVLLLHLRSPCR